MSRLFALLVVLCLAVGPPRATWLARAGDDASPTEQKEDTKEDAKETGKEAECSLGVEQALIRRPFTHPELHATGSFLPWPSDRSPGRSAFAHSSRPHPSPPLSRLPRRQI